MEQEQECENPQQNFCEYSIIRDIVLKVLKAQGIPNPSDEVIDSAIKEHLTPKVLGIIKKLNTEKSGPWKYLLTVFPHIRPAGIIILCSLQMRVLFENTTFFRHKLIRIAGIIRVAGIVRGRVLYEEIRYFKSCLHYCAFHSYASQLCSLH